MGWRFIQHYPLHCTSHFLDRLQIPVTLCSPEYKINEWMILCIVGYTMTMGVALWLHMSGAVLLSTELSTELSTDHHNTCGLCSPLWHCVGTLEADKQQISSYFFWPCLVSLMSCCLGNGGLPMQRLRTHHLSSEKMLTVVLVFTVFTFCCSQVALRFSRVSDFE